MTRSTALHCLTAAVLCAVLTSCTVTPVPDSGFAEFSEENGMKITLPLDMSDSTCSYNLSLMARFIKGKGPESVTMDITVISPSGIRGRETAVLPSDYYGIRSHLRSNPSDSLIRIAGTTSYYDISWVYRSGIIPEERGSWKMEIALRGKPEGVLGAGYILDRIPYTKEGQQDYGKR
ncbi:MAG TPA: hypothetical protein IAC05_06995 [Candidatus Coprenecus stercorigallinarum]|nr:hypothetical protein [Candidatus Coprenecus stercorigallinarum]